MSEPIPDTDLQSTEPVAEAEPPAPKPEKPAKDWEAEASKWKALARKHEDASKANADSARQFDEIDEARKTELEKANERADRAEKLAAEVEHRAVRAEVSATKAVPVELIHGGTREEMEASADRALAFRGAAPKPDFGAGYRGDDVGAKAKQLTREDMRRMTPEQIVKARADGLFEDLLKSTR